MTSARLPRQEIVRAANIAAEQTPGAAKRLKALAVMARNSVDEEITVDLDDFILLADHYRSK